MVGAIVRSEKDINRVLDWAAEGENEGSHFPGNSYEEGIRAMYEWLVGLENMAPDE